MQTFHFSFYIFIYDGPFFLQVMFGTTQEQARWRDCVTVTNNFLGFATSRLFVDRYFDESSKKVALEMIGKVRNSFNEILKELDWMDDEARKTAKEKADAISDSIGYPEFIQNNTALNNYYKTVSLNFINLAYSIKNTHCNNNLKF